MTAQQGSIYFILDQQAQAIKIGFAKDDVRHRLMILQTATPHKLELLGTTPGTRTDEHQLHGQFDHIHGEWFRISQALWSHIRDHTETTRRFGKQKIKKEGDLMRVLTPEAYRADVYAELDDLKARLDALT